MNTITIELCAEDRARLDKILAALEKPRDCKGCVETVSKATEHIVEIMTPQEAENAPQEAPEVKADEHPADVSTAPWEPTEDPQEEAQEEREEPVAVQELQKKVVDLCAKGMKDQVREIVNAYAKKVSDIPEDKRNEVYAQLTALEG